MSNFKYYVAIVVCFAVCIAAACVTDDADVAPDAGLDGGVTEFLGPYHDETSVRRPPPYRMAN